MPCPLDCIRLLLLPTLLSGCLTHTQQPAKTQPQPMTQDETSERALPEPVRDQPRQHADVAAPRVVEEPWMSLAEWRARHQRQLAHPDRAVSKLVFLGDSITEAWVETSELRARFARHAPLNLGIGGDQTQHLLWRIDDGTLDGLSPRLLVLLIGVNNLGNGFSPEETLAGIGAVVESVQSHLPNTKLLLLQVLPAGRTTADPLREAIRATNARLAEFSDPGRVELFDAGNPLLESDGSIAPSTMEDFLHPTADGFATLTREVGPVIERLLTQ
jgi:lysophospholipase L1-like esterase